MTNTVSTLAPPLTISQAIAREEGWEIPSSRCRRNHNPGNIDFGDFARAHGATVGDPRYAIFPSDNAGFNALKALLQTPTYKGLTISEAIAKWAPPIENDTDQYIRNICAWTELQPNTIIDAHL